MSKLVWDKTGERFLRNRINKKGVLYPQGEALSKVLPGMVLYPLPKVLPGAEANAFMLMIYINLNSLPRSSVPLSKAYTLSWMNLLSVMGLPKSLRCYDLDSRTVNPLVFLIRLLEMLMVRLRIQSYILFMALWHLPLQKRVIPH